MRYAVFGDVHSNLEALEAVLEDAYHQKCNAHACTGDLVGYNANPCECVRLIRALDCPTVKGNHDLDCSSDSDLSNRLNPVAQHALTWHRRNIDNETKQYLRELPLIKTVDTDDWCLVHASLDDPAGFTYMINENDLSAHFAYQPWNICFYGHTHTPRMWQYKSGEMPEDMVSESKVVLGKHRIYAFDVGSVGQPRDGDWRAAYMVFDTEERTVELRRVEYDIELTRLKIRQSGVMPPDFGE